MSGDREGLLSKMVGEPENVRGELVEIIRLHAFRLITKVVASLIRSHHVKATLGERRDLLPPRKPELGESVEQEY